MSALEAVEPQDDGQDASAVEPGGSLRDRIAKRTRKLEREPERIILLPVPGYDDFLSVQYRALDYREEFKLETRHEKVKDPADQLLLIAADKLINACERIVEQTGPDEFKDTGYKWGTQAARELFGKDLPDGTTGRQAIIAIFPDEEALVTHATEYETRRAQVRPGVEKDLEGESAAGSTTTV